MSNEAAALLAANRTRKKVRFWVTIVTLPIAIVAVAFSLKLFTMYAFAHHVIVSHVTGDHAGGVQASRWQEFFNVVEPYKAPFNAGISLVSNGDLESGRAKFEEALPLADGLAVCHVRVNLALTIERIGDAAARDNRTDDAMAFYAEALVVTLETPEECDSDEASAASSDPERDMSETLDDLEDRLRQKQQSDPGEQPEDPNGSPEEEPEPTPQPNQEQLEELERRLEQGAEEREEHQQGNDEGPSSGTDRPW